MRHGRETRCVHADRAGAPCAEPLESRVLLAVLYDGTVTPAGEQPVGVAVADFDGDGVLDAAVVDQTGDAVIVLLGRGDGTFDPAQTLETAPGPAAIVAGDVNGDGVPDLAVSEMLSNRVAVFLGRGDGTFDDGLRAIAIGAPAGLDLADFDGDGRLDVVVALSTTTEVWVLPGNGDGTFGPEIVLNAGLGPSAVRAADLNGDGAPEIVAANTQDDTISVFVNDGSGAFGAAVAYATGARPVGVAIGDVDGDGTLDVVTANAWANSVSIFAGDGQGALGAGVEAGAPGEPRSVETLDLDGDGRTDIVGTSWATGRLFTLIQLEEGGFSIGEYRVSRSPAQLVMADMNGDGVTDAVVPHAAGGTLGVFLRGDSGSFLTRNEEFADGGALAHADVNGDGIAELAVADPDEGAVRLYNVHFGVTLSERESIVLPAPASHLAFGDLNGDGAPDLVAMLPDANLLVWLLNDGTGSFAGPVNSIALDGGTSEVRLGDLNGNGLLDAVVRAADSGRLHVALNNGSGGLALDASYGVDYDENDANDRPVSIALGDLDGDGFLDIGVLMRGNDADFQWLRNDGSGRFGAAALAPGAPGNGRALALADVNGDGRLDAVAVNDLGQVVTWLNSGNGQLALGPTSEASPGATLLVMADINADGRPDAVVVDPDADSVIVLEGNGAGAFGQGAARTGYAIGGGAADLAVFDTDQNVYADLVVSSSAGPSVAMLRDRKVRPSIFGFDAQPSVIARDEALTLSLEGVDTDIPESIRRVAFFVDLNGDGIPDADELIGEDTDGSDGWSATLTLGAGVPLGNGLSVLAFAEDYAGVRSSVWARQLNVVFSVFAAPDGLVSGVADASGRYFVGGRNAFDRPVVFHQFSAGHEFWWATDILEATGAQDIIGELHLFLDEKDGLVYAAAASGDGLLLFRFDGEAWSVRNLRSETGFADRITSSVTVLKDTDGGVQVAGLTAGGDLVMYFQSGAVNEDGSYAWAASNITEEHLTPQGMATPAFVGRLTSYTTNWNARNVVGLDAAGRLHTIWIAGFPLWRVDDLSAITGAPALVGDVTIYLTTWDGINIAGTDGAGNLRVTWWVPQFGGVWELSDLTDMFAGPTLSGLASYVTPWGGLNVAGIDGGGELVIYWWVPQFAGEWVVSSITDVLPAGHPTPSGGGLTSFAATDGRLNIFGRGPGAEFVRTTWDMAADVWSAEDLTDTGARA